MVDILSARLKVTPIWRVGIKVTNFSGQEFGNRSINIYSSLVQFDF